MMTARQLGKQIGPHLNHSLGAPIFLVLLLGMMMVPLPPFMLDLLFTFNITLSLIIILAVFYATRPLDLGVFPTVLLLVTLLRLSLNIASTRVVLLHGHEGTQAAGKVIEAFGEFVIGGNYTIGLVVFAILVIINFVVITKGAGRVSEVTARFTLDAMPGRQMAIDADLNAGVIDQETASKRRVEIREEADFFGSMDGASKFVRGDAIAGILILFVNIIGGLAIGVVQHDLSFAEASHNYTLLTIGDGLVAQIPSLLMSTGTAVIVTRMSSPQEMGAQMASQLFANPRVLIISGGVLTALGLVPGMPNLVFLLIGLLSLYAAYRGSKAQKEPVKTTEEESAKPPEVNEDLGWDEVGSTDVLGLEVGYRLIALVDAKQGGPLMARIKGIRKTLTKELGFLVQPIHIRDNLELAPGGYRVSLNGVPVAEGEIHPGKELAINPGNVSGTPTGIQTKDPTFGLDAVWIESSAADHARTLGYTVVDASTVVATHLSHLIKTHAHRLLGHEEAQKLVDRVTLGAPKAIQELVPKTVSLSVVVRVLQDLLEEQVPIRDMKTILETLAEKAPITSDPALLLRDVRRALGTSITHKINGLNPELPAFTLAPKLEQILQQGIRQTTQDSAQGGLGHAAIENNSGMQPDMPNQQGSTDSKGSAGRRDRAQSRRSGHYRFDRRNAQTRGRRRSRDIAGAGRDPRLGCPLYPAHDPRTQRTRIQRSATKSKNTPGSHRRRMRNDQL